MLGIPQPSICQTRDLYLLVVPDRILAVSFLGQGEPARVAFGTA